MPGCGWSAVGWSVGGARRQVLGARQVWHAVGRRRRIGGGGLDGAVRRRPWRRAQSWGSPGRPAPRQVQPQARRRVQPRAPDGGRRRRCRTAGAGMARHRGSGHRGCSDGHHGFGVRRVGERRRRAEDQRRNDSQRRRHHGQRRRLAIDPHRCPLPITASSRCYWVLQPGWQNCYIWGCCDEAVNKIFDVPEHVSLGV